MSVACTPAHLHAPSELNGWHATNERTMTAEDRGFQEIAVCQVLTLDALLGNATTVPSGWLAPKEMIRFSPRNNHTSGDRRTSSDLSVCAVYAPPCGDRTHRALVETCMVLRA